MSMYRAPALCQALEGGGETKVGNLQFRAHGALSAVQMKDETPVNKQKADCSWPGFK